MSKRVVAWLPSLTSSIPIWTNEIFIRKLDQLLYITRAYTTPMLKEHNMPKASPALPPIPPAFTAKKNAILASLAVPSPDYTDASPKGSVDEAIKGLIDRVNAFEGIVTTSSCAGRISVFAEGRKERKHEVGVAGEEPKSTRVGDSTEEGEGAGQKVVPGGKGMGGKWLFVSHEPLPQDLNGYELAEMFGLGGHACDRQGLLERTGRSKRLIRFQFEPMVCRYGMASYFHPDRLVRSCTS